MNRYAITVRRWWAVPAALAVLVLICSAIGTSTVPVPSLTRGAGGAQLAYFTPVLVVIAVMYCLERQLHEAETTAVLPVRLLDQGAVVLTALLAHGAGLLVGMDIARNVTLLLGIALLVRRMANEATAAGAGLMFLILNIILGRAIGPNGHSTHAWWAIVLYPSGNMPAWLLAVALFALALPLAFSRTSVSR
ncbi:hypothetical protein G3I19_18840 [Streptomyces sp. SID10853]|uniref:hypothetical protein n=1 Tax=Streptomyces sp. SID10853 TaxID=2706028 RepID=UPI0013C1B109|nr:hypothetical protein [Streptomyces sp. SID10853]NDZ80546.1 hypothetical protein [Streptomyces sp. SID10853]